MAPTTDDDDKYTEQSHSKGVHPFVAIVLIVLALVGGLLLCNAWTSIFL